MASSCRTVKVVSKKLEKPSNPTPSDLGILNLSLFDQIAPRIYTDVIFYYLGSEDGGSRAESAKRMAQLEKSLSQTLTFFYPLAGRFMEKDISIDCGDQGVEYFEAQVNEKLEEFLQEPETEDLNKFLPWNSPPAANLASSPLLSIQINSFDCGGIVLGISISHILADGSSIFRFINEWASNNRTGIHPVLCPSLSYSQFASFFPARRSLSGTKLTLVRSSKAPQSADDGGGKLVARKKFPDETVISNIRDQAASFLIYKPTRVVVIIALLWKALMGVSQVKHGYLRNSVVSLAMNLRGKQSLQLPELNYGNFWVPVPVSYVASENKIELHNLITLLGDTIRDTKEKNLKMQVLRIFHQC